MSLRLLLASILALTPPVLLHAETRPNIVFIMADDLGLGDVAHHVRTFQKKKVIVPTPNIDALAAAGMWFTDGHSSTALCSPTRYCTMSGNLNYRSYAPWGVWGTFRESPFKPGQATLGSVTHAAGYATAFIGKWHLGGDFRVKGSDKIFRGEDRADPDFKVDVSKWVGGGPQSIGFEYSFALPCGIQGPVYNAYENGDWYPFQPNSQIVYLNKDNAIDPKFVSDKGPGPGDSQWDTRKVGKMLSQKASDFIGKQSAQKPFFLCYWSPQVHLPHCPPEEFNGVKIAGQTPTPHLDFILDLDQQVKAIVDALKKAGVFENTLIIFSSDNGGLTDGAGAKAGHDSNGGYRGNKNTPYEGGHRVPFFATWPGKIRPGSVSDVPVATHDVLATIAAIAGTSVPADQAMDSANLLPLFTGTGNIRPHEELLLQGGSKSEIIYRKGDWKLIIQSNHKVTKFEPMALFHLGNNPQEKEEENFIRNPEHKARVDEMFKRYMDIRNSGVATVTRKR